MGSAELEASAHHNLNLKREVGWARCSADGKADRRADHLAVLLMGAERTSFGGASEEATGVPSTPDCWERNQPL